MNNGWNPQDLAEVLETARPYWERLRTEVLGKPMAGRPVGTIPGFTESLWSLMEQGYTLTDIGAMFGVTRERVRQWTRRLGLPQLAERNSQRRWSDERGCFVVVPRAVMRSRRVLDGRMKRRRLLDARQDARRVEQVDTLKQLALDLGRTPTLAETSREFGTSVASLAFLWRREGDATPYREAFARLYRAAGLEVRALGGHGHVDYHRAGMAYA